MAVTIALVSRKGGVGKTSLSIDLAGMMASDGCRVRLVDLDPQASASQQILGCEAVENLHPRETVEALVTGRATAEQVTRRTQFEGVSLIPCHFAFEALRMRDSTSRRRRWTCSFWTRRPTS